MSLVDGSALELRVMFPSSVEPASGIADSGTLAGLGADVTVGPE
jgi:hypothetical protein